MSASPPSESFAQSASRCSFALGSMEGSKFSMNEIDGLNLKYGPALMAMKEKPHRSNDRMSQSPEGVFFRTDACVILESPALGEPVALNAET